MDIGKAACFRSGADLVAGRNPQAECNDYGLRSGRSTQPSARTAGAGKAGDAVPESIRGASGLVCFSMKLVSQNSVIARSPLISLNSYYRHIISTIKLICNVIVNPRI